MMVRVVSRVTLVVSLLLSSLVMANDPVKFAQHAQFTSVTVSPQGDYLAVGILHEGRRAAAILDFDTKEVLTLVTFRNQLEAGGMAWVSDDRLLVTMSRKIGLLERPGSAGELYAVNADGSKGLNIFGFMGVEPVAASGRYLGKLDDDHILVETHPWSGVAGKDLQPSVMRVNIHNGRTREITRTNIRGASFYSMPIKIHGLQWVWTTSSI